MFCEAHSAHDWKLAGPPLRNPGSGRKAVVSLIWYKAPMNRRSILALLLALALSPSVLLASAARAEDGADDAGAGEDDSGDSDSGEDGGEGDGGSDDTGDDSGDDVTGGGETDDGDTPNGGEDDHDDALRAVTAKDAIPLKQMLQQFERQFDGTIVDVTLIRDTDSLRYRVKFIDPAGRVRRAYFDAVTGALVQ